MYANKIEPSSKASWELRQAVFLEMRLWELFDDGCRRETLPAFIAACEIDKTLKLAETCNTGYIFS
jgi:hypothetical protein